ncbi:MAG: ribose-phosphate diphosphokinase [Novosphingobium sp.]
MTCAVFSFAETHPAAAALATELGVPVRAIEVRNFPDGESLVRVPEAARTAILYRSLDNPNAKLVELLLATAALRDGGARRVVLVAPYLAYMRQDMAFHPGEAVSQRIIGGLLAERFDALLTLDPHLHRIASLSEAVPRIPALALSAAPVLSGALDAGTRPVLVGPDAESRPWVAGIAAPLGLDVLVGEKHRDGDRAVRLSIPSVDLVRGRPAVLVDDVISSGMTMIAAARQLLDAGATGVEALATHCLASQADLAALRAAGIARIRATASVPGPVAELPVAALIAQALRDEDWLG